MSDVKLMTAIYTAQDVSGWVNITHWTKDRVTMTTDNVSIKDTVRILEARGAKVDGFDRELL